MRLAPAVAVKLPVATWFQFRFCKVMLFRNMRSSFLRDTLPKHISCPYRIVPVVLLHVTFYRAYILPGIGIIPVDIYHPFAIWHFFPGYIVMILHVVSTCPLRILDNIANYCTSLEGTCKIKLMWGVEWRRLREHSHRMIATQSNAELVFSTVTPQFCTTALVKRMSTLEHPKRC